MNWYFIFTARCPMAAIINSTTTKNIDHSFVTACQIISLCSMCVCTFQQHQQQCTADYMEKYLIKCAAALVLSECKWLETKQCVCVHARYHTETKFNNYMIYDMACMMHACESTTHKANKLKWIGRIDKKQPKLREFDN